MSSENGSKPTGPLSAEDLRKRMAERELEEAKKAIEKQKKAQSEEAEFKDFFMRGEITDEERERFRNRVLALAERGETEACVMTFPSSFCSDGGRAINNFEADWHKTLIGRAATAFELWDRNAKPLGYKLQARVLSYPNGIIGDIGLYITW